jgi:hypothetical protein
MADPAAPSDPPRGALRCAQCSTLLNYVGEVPRFCSYCGKPLDFSGLAATVDLPHSPAFAVTATLPPPANVPIHRLKLSNPTLVDRPITTLGQFQLGRQLGSGGMGAVYEATETGSGRRVAVKLIHSRLADSLALERFQQEGRLASQISHPRCVFVLAAADHEGTPYIVMELMPGSTLKEVVETCGPLPVQEALARILEIIDGLQEAHRLGLIHRDVKPSNCFVQADGTVKVGDFGLCKSTLSTDELTSKGMFLGTVLFAPPEQIRGLPVTYAGDVYSVTATLWYLLAGQAPFHHDTMNGAMARVLTDPLPYIGTLRAEVPVGLARVLERGLARDLHERYATLDELRSALEAFVPRYLSFSGLSARAGAYLIDELTVDLVLVGPLLTVLALFGNTGWEQAAASTLAFVLYFTYTDGVRGASVGKWLLRMRVCTVGTVEPPGWWRGLLRTLLFFALVHGTISLPGILAKRLTQEGWSWWATSAVACVPALIGLALVLGPMRPSNHFRGLHDLLTGTGVLRRARRREAPQLQRRQPDRLERFPPRDEPWPAQVGPYVVQGVQPAPEGQAVLLAHDPTLCRRVFLWFRPLVQGQFAGGGKLRRGDVSRPTRLRHLNGGTHLIGGTHYRWDAFVAPAGFPLVDAVRPAQPVSWATARLIIEQLLEELQAAQTDHTLPEVLTIEQVWIDATGRVQVLDCPLGYKTAPTAPADPALALVQSTTALLLTGSATPGPVEAVLPPPARAWVDQLMARPSFAEVPTAHAALKPLLDEPACVTRPWRAGTLGLSAGLNALGVVMMVLGALTFLADAVKYKADVIARTDTVLPLLTDEAQLQTWLADPRVAPHLADPKHKKWLDPKVLERIIAQQERDQTELARREQMLGLVQRAWLAAGWGEGLPAVATPTDSVLWVADRAKGHGGMYYFRSPHWIEETLAGNALRTLLWVWAWPTLWAIWAFAIRGSGVFWLLGLTLIDRNGRRASRRRCLLRTIYVWLPLALLLSAAILAQTGLPPGTGAAVHIWLWLLAVSVGTVQLVGAYAWPERSWPDAWAGTVLVPR